MAMMGEQKEEMMEEKQQGDMDIKKVLNQVGQGLAKIAEMVNSSPEMQDADKESIAEIMSKYIDFVENKLADKGESSVEPADAGQMPMNQGMGGVPMGPQYKS